MTKVVRQLLLLNVAAFFLLNYASNSLYYSLAFVPGRILSTPWSLLTYQFLHAGFSHLFFNMLALFFFGPKLEHRLGSRRFLGLYIFAGVVGALVHTGAAFGTGSGTIPMVGASAAVYGVLFAYARFWPRDRVMLWLIVPIPVRVLVILFTLISLWSGLGGVGGGVAHFAHLGGFLGGFLFLSFMAAPARRFQRQAQSPSARMTGQDLTAELTRIDPNRLHPVNRQLYAEIKHKVEVAGWGAVTDQERASIHRFSHSSPRRESGRDAGGLRLDG